jgi:serine/threonine protein kinase
VANKALFPTLLCTTQNNKPKSSFINTMTVATFSLIAEGLAWSATTNSRQTKASINSNNFSLFPTKKKPSKKRSQHVLAPTVNVIQDYVERVVETSRILNDTSSNNTRIASLSRSALSIGKTVGEGSFSQVCAVRRRGRSCENQVIKQLNPKLFSTSHTDKEKIHQAQKALDHAAADLMLEALYLSRLQHPNIISVSAISNSIHDCFFVIEALPKTLDVIIHEWRTNNKLHSARDPTLLKHQLKYASQLSSALAYLHERRIIFRDLKPENIGIAKDDSVRLIDFGLARELPSIQHTKPKAEAVPSSRRTSASCHDSVSSSTSSLLGSKIQTTSPSFVEDNTTYHMTQVGTMRYCAGEILMGEPYNAKCDVYSFGIVLYELVTLQTPFPNLNMQSQDSQQEHIAKVCVGGKRPGLSLYQLLPAFEKVIRKTWQRNPLKRPSSAQVNLALGHAYEETVRI